jgi:5S rRNA maturation endonuclease (ribonuclease M5)
MKTTSHSYDQDKLKITCDQLCDKIELLFEALGLDDIKLNGKMYVGNCPIHNGDNKTAFNLYPDGDYYRGNWKCRTHQCEKIFKGSIIGFIRGVLSTKKKDWEKDGDDMVSFKETINFINSFLGDDINNVKISKKDIEKKNFARTIQNLVNPDQELNPSKVTRHTVRQLLKIPSEYFVQRGFSKDILDKYDIGFCSTNGKEMFGRAVVPVYDNDNKFVIGCSGRSIYDICKECHSFHDPKMSCPEQDDRWKFSKWKHSKDFKSQNYLYNYWNAKKHIAQSHKVIIVESPGNVWKLEEAGIHNSVAIFGSNLSDRQKIILDGSGAMTMIILMDNDDAGRKAAELINAKCRNTYNVINISISKPDVAEMTLEEINKEIRVLI